MSSQKKSRHTLIKKSPSSTVSVRLGKRSYPIYIGRGILSRAGTYCKRLRIGQDMVIITDSNVGRLYLKPLVKSLTNSGFHCRWIVIPPGESQKSAGRAQKIYTQLLRWKIERSSTIIALGGGVIGDLAGFIAATYQRGIGFIQIPTSLLAQVDSSVGGKVGINHPIAKNMIGAFYQPLLVLADIQVLKSLPRRELICGIGEVIKYGIILDRPFFQFVSGHVSDILKNDPPTLARVVRRCCELKAYVVSKDERESGIRSFLNFGHTVGHALERAGKYSALKHGEAILYGMIAETYIARRNRLITLDQQRHIESAISLITLPPLSNLRFSHASLLKSMMVDKKVQAGKIRMVLPAGIGKIIPARIVSEKEILQSLRYLQDYSSTKIHSH